VVLFRILGKWRELQLRAPQKINIGVKMNKLRYILLLQYFRTKLVALLYPWKNIKIPVAQCKYTREEPVAKYKIGPQRQNVAQIGIYFMLWARQSWGDKEKKKKKGGKEEGKRRGKKRKECTSTFYCQSTVCFVCSTNI
jgi:hypothetical protein